MTLRGHIQDGEVVLPSPAALPDGTVVTISPVRKPAKRRGTPGGKSASAKLTWAQKYAPVIGKAKGLPSDLSINHDHYLYGTPKEA